MLRHRIPAPFRTILRALSAAPIAAAFSIAAIPMVAPAASAALFPRTVLVEKFGYAA